ncbi:MAG TPA: hypothetical protein VLB44_27015 [Kofleriaceae bacterium]|nr:hypothetical protein [Kofleriaceae bacterium]
MRSVERERQRGVEDHEQPVSAPEPSTAGRFRSDGPLPPVGGEFATPGPTASDLAYGDDRLPKELLDKVASADEPSLVSMLQAYPTIQGAIVNAIHRVHGPQVAHSVVKSRPAEATATEGKTKALPEGYDGGPIRVDADHATDRQKVAGFDQVANSHTREAAAPSHVRLPPAVVRSLDEMWAESNTKNQEQGGNVVRTYGGHYEMKRTHDSSDDSETYNVNTGNVGRFDHHVAIAHTHPVDKSSPDFVGFSIDDLVGIVDEEQPLNILRSGNQTYMISRTKEFDALVDKTNNDPEKLSDLRSAMRDTYMAALHAELQAGGSRSSSVEAGVIAVCRTFHLIYYWGQGQDLHRVR